MPLQKMEEWMLKASTMPLITTVILENLRVWRSDAPTPPCWHWLPWVSSHHWVARLYRLGLPPQRPPHRWLGIDSTILSILAELMTDPSTMGYCINWKTVASSMGSVGTLQWHTTRGRPQWGLCSISTPNLRETLETHWGNIGEILGKDWGSIPGRTTTTCGNIRPKHTNEGSYLHDPHHSAPQVQYPEALKVGDFKAIRH